MRDKDIEDAGRMAGNMISFLKNIFRTNIECMLMFQDQNLRILNTWIEGGLIAQKETIRVFEEWTKNTRLATLEFQRITEENFEKLQQFLG